MAIDNDVRPRGCVLFDARESPVPRRVAGGGISERSEKARGVVSPGGCLCVRLSPCRQLTARGCDRRQRCVDFNAEASASGLAEVSLTFENTKNLLPTEFNTVTVTRKFYKSG